MGRDLSVVSLTLLYNDDESGHSRESRDFNATYDLTLQVLTFNVNAVNTLTGPGVSKIKYGEINKFCFW